MDMFCFSLSLASNIDYLINVCLQGADRYYNNITDMIGYRPSRYMEYCWKFLTPCLSAVSK